MGGRAGVGTAILVPLLLGCTNPPVLLPAVRSSGGTPGNPEFQAGIGRSDITPVPGLGLTGYGSEGKPAAGYRTRLYARALVLQDTSGQRLAIVVADLPLMSMLVQRTVAMRIAAETGIGTDHLIICATHTHAGPGHYLDSNELNAIGSQVPCYDTVVVDFLVDAVARAVVHAVENLHPARLAWGSFPVWGYTRNRSYEAYRRNAPSPGAPFPPPPGLDPAQQAVDPTWTMLRVDLREPSSNVYWPVAALSVFAIHGTGNPGENDLYDGDIHAIVERVVERHIADLNGPASPFLRTTAHLFANGAEGDVSPDWPASTRCPLPVFRPTPRPGGPRTPAAWSWDHGPRSAVARCLSNSREYVDAVGEALGRRAIGFFDSLGRVPRVAPPTIAVNFRTLALARDHEALGLCPTAVPGTATAAGAPDGQSRFAGWHFLGLIPLGIEEGGRAVNRNPRDCQREKNTLLRPLTRKHGFGEYAQLSVVRIGGMILIAVPAEVTTMTGRLIAGAVRDSVQLHGPAGDSIAIIDLADGYLNYVATAAEYTAQHYEGGSTLYGPHEAAMLATELGKMGGELRRANWTTIPGLVDTVAVYPGKPTTVVAARGSRPVDRRVLSMRCSGDTLTATWVDRSPGMSTIAAGRLIAIQHKVGDEWTTVATDDDPQVEVRLVERRGDRGGTWQVLWSASRGRGEYRVMLLGRGELSSVEGWAESC
jgi:neutral ceramidase